MSIPDIARALRDHASKVWEDDVKGYADGSEATLRILVEKGALPAGFYEDLVAELSRQAEEEERLEFEGYFGPD